MDLELVLFKACPFAQRVVIALLHTGLACRQTVINPAQPPAWLGQLSPSGQVPLLRVDGQHAIFDSSAINEYLNERAGSDLLPDTPLARAHSRCWIEHAGVCQRAFGALITAKTETEFEKAGKNFLDKLRWLEGVLEEGGRFFREDRLSLVDVAYAPLFMRMQHLQRVVAWYPEGRFPRIEGWQEALLALAVVAHSVGGDFSPIFQNMVRNRGAGGFVVSRLT